MKRSSTQDNSIITINSRFSGKGNKHVSYNAVLSEHVAVDAAGCSTESRVIHPKLLPNENGSGSSPSRTPTRDVKGKNKNKSRIQYAPVILYALKQNVPPLNTYCSERISQQSWHFVELQHTALAVQAINTVGNMYNTQSFIPEIRQIHHPPELNCPSSVNTQGNHYNFISNA